MFEDLLTFEDLHEACVECFGFEGVKFKRDFGPLKKDVRYETVWFQLDSGKVEVFDDDDNKTHEFNFILESELKS